MQPPLHEVVRELSSALRTTPGTASTTSAADRLCRACVDLLDVDGASISLIYEAKSRGTLGSSSPTSRRLDDLQFTLGEGPCLDAAATRTAVLVDDLDDPAEHRWPAYRAAAREADVCAVFAIPVSLTQGTVGALDLFRRRRGPLSGDTLDAAQIAATLAAQPLLDILTADVDWDSIADGAPWPQIATLERVEVNQATGMIIAALDLDPHEALLRLRAHAFARDQTATEIAVQIVTGRLNADLTD